MGEVKRYRPIDLMDAGQAYGKVVLASDYATLEAERNVLDLLCQERFDELAMLKAELAKLKGEYEWVTSINTALDESNQSAWAENAKLRAELERRAVPDGRLIVPIQPTEEMRKRAQDYLAAEGMIVSDWLVHTTYTEMLAAAPSAPKADPVKAQLLTALEDALWCLQARPSCQIGLVDQCKCAMCVTGRMRAAIAAARQEGWKV